MAELRIISTPPELKAEWRRLYEGYLTFYKRPCVDGPIENLWSWVQNPAHEVEGILALRDGKPVGLAHFRRMPSPSRGADIGFLDDLFVDPACRGSGAAEALILHVKSVARERGWEIVRWLTADDNYRARALYDRLSKKAGWNVYEMKSAD